MNTMNEIFKYWTPDEVAECMTVNEATYCALWALLADEPREFCETPDAKWEKYSLAKYWDKLTPEQQAECNRAAAAALDNTY